MHPPLDRPHPDCQDVIKELKRCHAENKWKKYIGECNEAKYRLDQCFRAEKKKKLAEEADIHDKLTEVREEMLREEFGTKYGRGLTLMEFQLSWQKRTLSMGHLLQRPGRSGLLTCGMTLLSRLDIVNKPKQFITRYGLQRDVTISYLIQYL